jgi:hypothetical protein
MRYVQANGDTFIRYLVDNGEPVFFSENHNVRPSKLAPEDALNLGVFKLKLVTPPPYDPLTQTRIDVDAVLVDGVWTQMWQVVDLSIEEILQRKTTQSDAAREARNAKLVESDWTQVSDAPVNKTLWATYRQALRDVTKQSGFPWTINWPTQP